MAKKTKNISLFLAGIHKKTNENVTRIIFIGLCWKIQCLLLKHVRMGELQTKAWSESYKILNFSKKPH